MGPGFGRGAPLNSATSRPANGFSPGQSVPQSAASPNQPIAAAAPAVPTQPVDFEFLPLICDIMRLVEEGYAANADTVRYLRACAYVHKI